MLKIKEESELQNFIAQITKFRLYPLITTSTNLSQKFNLSENHFVALVTIIKQEEPFVSTIAQTLFTSISKASRIVRDLENAELIKRKYGENEDRRKIKLEPTPKGYETTSSLFKDLIDFFDKILLEFDQEELIGFTASFEKFNALADESIQKKLNLIETSDRKIQKGKD